MRATFILDCSIVMAWCFADERTTAAARVQDRLETEAVVVPPHWFLEVANVLTLAERRNRITAAETSSFLASLSEFEIEVDEAAASGAFTRLMPLCRQHGLTSYDAAYLDLAARRELPLATLDAALSVSAKVMGIDIIGM